MGASVLWLFPWTQSWAQALSQEPVKDNVLTSDTFQVRYLHFNVDLLETMFHPKKPSDGGNLRHRSMSLREVFEAVGYQIIPLKPRAGWHGINLYHVYLIHLY